MVKMQAPAKMVARRPKMSPTRPARRDVTGVQFTGQRESCGTARAENPALQCHAPKAPISRMATLINAQRSQPVTVSSFEEDLSSHRREFDSVGLVEIGLELHMPERRTRIKERVNETRQSSDSEW